jgi:hypothetical protein
MFPVPVEVSWSEAAVWLTVILGAGFLVSWLATDVGRLRRDPYILVLAIVTVGLTGGYLAWVDLGVLAVLGHHVIEGVMGGIVAGVVVARGIVRLPATAPETERGSTWAAVWQGGVYGVAEGILLSALPVLVVWNAAQTSGWPDTWSGAVASGALALLAGAVMITVHHLGYWDFRNRQLVPVVLGCSVLSLAFLLTGSLLAPVIGHVTMHVVGLRHGVALPPHEHEKAPQATTPS